MQTDDKKSGHVVTFYSYKGGTGRSMALSNVAVLLAQSKKRVLMVDWDLEAPGLPKYFHPYLPKNFDRQPGLIDFFERADKELPGIKFDSTEEAQLDTFFPYTKEYIIPVKAPDTAGNLFLLKAGRERKEGYADQIGSFNWEQFFYKIRSFFTKWAQYLSKQYDYVLIDSRTGHTDTGGICTMQMPDKLVLVFTPNHQSFEGTSNLARKAVQHRRRSHDLRPLMVYFLPSRIELNEDKLRAEWLLNYQREITELYATLYEQPHISLENYVKRVQVRHASSYAYEEKLAVIEEKVDDTNSLSRVYRDFLTILDGEKPIWTTEVNGKDRTPVKTFIVYAQKDSSFANDLIKHLSPFVTNGKLIVSSDNEIKAGEKWSKTIRSQLNAADLILMLVSADMLNTSYINDEEIPIAIKRATTGDTVVVPILLRACAWQETPLASLQILPQNARPISSWTDQDEAYSNVTSNLSKIIDNIHARSH